MTCTHLPSSPPPRLHSFTFLALTSSIGHTHSCIQIDIQIQNEYYIRDHPELKYLIQNFYTEVLEKKPKDVTQFAVSYFTRPTTVLKRIVENLQNNDVHAATK